MWKSIAKDTEEKHYKSVNLNKAKERLQEKDKFDKKVIGRKLRHMEKRLKRGNQKRSQQEANKGQR